MTTLHVSRDYSPSAGSQIERPKSRRTPALLALGVFVAHCAALVAAGGFSLLQWTYPAFALVVAALLYRISPAHYLAFVWWLFFLSPFVRRIVDYHLSWNWANPINLSPLLAAAVCVFSIRLAGRKGNELHFVPLLLIATGILFGYIVGLQNAGFVAASYAAFNWLMPPILCFHIACYHLHFPEFRDTLTRTFIWGGLITGVYGLMQYFYLPRWDAEWLIRAQIFGQMVSGGLPLPYYVRVFSTMNSPAPFASVMMATIIIILNTQHKLRWFAAPPVLISLLLSIVRTAWGGLGVAWLYTIVRLRTSATVRQLLVGACVLVAALPLLTVESVSNIVNKRFESLLKLTEDSSYTARAESYQNAVMAVSTNFAGNGLGATGTATKLNNQGSMGEHGDFDSGLLEIPFNLGWPGAFLYTVGVLWFLYSGLLHGRSGGPNHQWNVACGGIVIGTLSECFLTNSLTAGVGMIFWCFLGMLLAEKAFRASSRTG
jgi:hypothetical protein